MMKKIVIGMVAVGLLTAVAESATQTPDIDRTQEFSLYSERDIQCLALNIYHESRNESFAGQVAVADVTLNRLHDSRYPSTICNVVKQSKLSQWHLEQGREVPARNKCQFSWFCDGKSDEPRDGDSWLISQQVARSFLTYGEFRGLTEGATHYHASYVNPNWVNDRGMNMVGSIGEHIFYRWN